MCLMMSCTSCSLGTQSSTLCVRLGRETFAGCPNKDLSVGTLLKALVVGEEKPRLALCALPHRNLIRCNLVVTELAVGDCRACCVSWGRQDKQEQPPSGKNPSLHKAQTCPLDAKLYGFETRQFRIASAGRTQWLFWRSLPSKH